MNETGYLWYLRTYNSLYTLCNDLDSNPLNETGYLRYLRIYNILSRPFWTYKVKAFRELSQDNINKFCDVLQEFTCNFIVFENDNVNIEVNLFMDGLYTLYNECFPIRWKNMSRNRLLKPWITNKLINVINAKFRLFEQYKLGFISFPILQLF